MNHVSIFGRFTRDPELRHTQQGKAVANFSLAVNRYGGDEADFFECVAWEKQAESINNSCKKGHRLLVWGRLQQERWTDQQSGQTRTTVKVIVSGFSFIEPAPQQGQAPQNQPPAGPPGYVPPANGYQQPPYQGQMPPQAGGYQQPPHNQGQWPNQPQQGQRQQPNQPPAGQYGQQPTNQQQQMFQGQQQQGQRQQHPPNVNGWTIDDCPF